MYVVSVPTVNFGPASGFGFFPQPAPASKPRTSKVAAIIFMSDVPLWTWRHSNATRLRSQGTRRSDRTLRRNEIAVRPQPAEPPRSAQHAARTQTHRLDLAHAETHRLQQPAGLTAREQVQRQVGHALMDRHHAVAGHRPSEQGRERVAQQPTS